MDRAAEANVSETKVPENGIAGCNTNITNLRLRQIGLVVSRDWRVRRFTFPLALLTVCASLGCGGNADGPFALSGTVALDDQPLEQGSITFSSVGAASKSSTGGAIRNGAYSIPAERGLVAGTYRVSISAADTSKATAAGLPPNGLYFPSLISPEFNEAKHQIEVTAEGSNEFPFNAKHAK